MEKKDDQSYWQRMPTIPDGKARGKKKFDTVRTDLAIPCDVETCVSGEEQHLPGRLSPPDR